METSTDLGVSLDELSIEINHDDNLRQVKAMGDSRDGVDVDVLDLVNSQNADIYGILEMDASTDLGVSLDELTVEINEGDNLQQITTINDSRVDADVLKFGNTVKIDEHEHMSAHLTTDMETWSTHEKMIMTEAMNIEGNTHSSPALKNSYISISNKDDSDSEFEVPDRPLAPPENASIIQLAAKDSSDSEFEVPDRPLAPPENASIIQLAAKDSSDSEFEVPDRPLAPPENASIIQLAAKDSSDFEFEVPDRPFIHPGNASIIHSAAKLDSDSEFEVSDRPLASHENVSFIQAAGVHEDLILNQELAGMQYIERNQDININLTSQNLSQLQQQILCSHSNISTDPVVLPQSSQIPTAHYSSLPIQNNNLEVSKATIEDSLKSTFEGDVKKTSQDIFTKSNQRIMQHQISDVTRPHVIFPVNTETEDGKHNEVNYSKPSIVTTADDWENIETIEPGFLQPSDRLSGPEPIQSKPLTSFSDSWTFFKTADYTSVKGQIKVQVERHGLSAIKHMLFGPPKLHRDLLPQRELIFCVAATPFDNNNEIHNRVLQTIYRCLTGSRFDCQRFGSHWEEIGFQGKDPATDLRGTGMLALLHLLYFLQSPSTKDLARDVYKLSLHPTQNFPFCVMGINLSRICLQVLREDVYNKECNRCRDVISTVNNIYAALFLHFYGAWKKGKTIMDSGFVLQEIETYSRKHSKDIFKEFKAYEQDKKQGGQSRKDSDAEPIFLNVCKDNNS